MLLLDLFLTFAKMGAMTFGGGYAMLPILQREVVEKKKWATEDQLADYYAVGQCTPGIVATLGVVFPSILIILAIAAFLSGFMHLEAVAHAFNGVRAGVVALILVSIIKLFKGAVKDWPTRIIYTLVLALAAAGNFVTLPAATSAGVAAVWNLATSPVFLVILSGAIGLAIRMAKGGLKS